MILPGIRCACGSADLVAVKPGTLPRMCAAGGFPVDRGEPDAAWRFACWPVRPVQRDLFARVCP